MCVFVPSCNNNHHRVFSGFTPIAENFTQGFHVTCHGDEIYRNPKVEEGHYKLSIIIAFSQKEWIIILKNIS